MEHVFTISQIIRLLIRAYSFMILGSVLLSWFTMGGGHPSILRAQEFLDKWVDPFLAPIRQVLSPLTSRIGLDFSPIVGLMTLNLIEWWLP